MAMVPCMVTAGALRVIGTLHRHLVDDRQEPVMPRSTVNQVGLACLIGFDPMVVILHAASWMGAAGVGACRRGAVAYIWARGIQPTDFL